MRVVKETTLIGFIDTLKEFATSDTAIESVIVVGSYARGTSKPTSDLDLCIITINKHQMIENPGFVEAFGKVVKMQKEYYGACTSIRVWYENGMEVEFGVVEPSWIDIPLDRGTYQVLSDGYKVIVDKKQYFKNLKL